MTTVQLPKWITLIQALAWGMLRDVAMVERAGDFVTPSSGHWAEMNLPSGPALVELEGKPGLSVTKMIGYRLCSLQEGSPSTPDFLAASNTSGITL